MKHKVMIGDIPCWWKEFGPIKSIGCGPVERFCPVCGEKVDQFTGCVLLINNYLLFPNISCHLKCFPKDRAEETIRWIWEHYNKSKIALEKALAEGKPWFSYIEM